MNPLYIPDFDLKINDRHWQSPLKQRVSTLTLTDNQYFEADTLSITLEDSDNMLDLPQRGVTLRFALGWQNQPLIDKGTFIVDEITYSGAPDSLTITARSTNLRKGINSKRDQSWHEIRLEQIIHAIASANQLQYAISPALKNRFITHLDQIQESDINLLVRLAKEHHALTNVKNGILLFYQANEAVSVSHQPLPIVKFTKPAIESFSFTLADRAYYHAVKAKWYDFINGTAGTVQVTQDDPSSANAAVSNSNKKN